MARYHRQGTSLAPVEGVGYGPTGEDFCINLEVEPLNKSGKNSNIESAVFNKIEFVMRIRKISKTPYG
jgi:hypothetical protein